MTTRTRLGAHYFSYGVNSEQELQTRRRVRGEPQALEHFGLVNQSLFGRQQQEGDRVRRAGN